MWLLPSWQRPELCRRTIEACEATGMTSPGLIFVDPPHDDYDFTLPGNWEIIRSPARVGMAEAHRLFLHQYPAEDFYGCISDDMIPKTTYWDQAFETAAWNEKRQGHWNVVCCHDGGYLSETKHALTQLPGAIGFGGDIVRAVGWLALPDVFQTGIDDAWVELAIKRLDCRIYLEDVVVEHLQHRTGKRPVDATDTVSQDHLGSDMTIFGVWRDRDAIEVERRVRAAWSQSSGS